MALYKIVNGVPAGKMSLLPGPEAFDIGWKEIGRTQDSYKYPAW